MLLLSAPAPHFAYRHERSWIDKAASVAVWGYHRLRSGTVLPLSAPRPLLMLPAPRPLRVFSHGGGKDSTAAVVMQALGLLPEPYDYFVFANTGHDSEKKKVLEYIQQYTIPFCKAHGINFVIVQKERDGKPVTLKQEIERSPHSVVIPAYTAKNKGRLRRNCTEDFKIAVVAKWIREHGYRQAVIGLGISVDEFERARDTNWYKEDGIEKKREYPLITMRKTRQDCINIVIENGLPEPPSSKCSYCPLNTAVEWNELYRNEPDVFADAVALEATINAKETSIRSDYIFLHRHGVPLAQAVADQPMLPMLEQSCESGYCNT